MMKKRIDYNTRVIEKKMDPANKYLFLKYHLNSDIIAPISIIQATHPTKDISKKIYEKKQLRTKYLHNNLEPRSYYQCEKKIQLPQETIQTEMTFEQLVAKRRSLRNTIKYTLNIKELSYLLNSSLGITKSIIDKETGHVFSFRAAPSGGGLYPIETFIIPLNICKLELDLYHYNCYDHSLEKLNKQLSFKKVSDIFFNIETVTSSSVLIILTAKFKRSSIKYGERSYRFILFEAGAILEHVALAAEAIDLRSVMLGGYIDSSLNEIIGCNSVDESVILCGAVGKENPDQSKFSL